MDERRPNKSNGSDSEERREAEGDAHPAEVARRELVEWCKIHKLPVPAEYQPRPR